MHHLTIKTFAYPGASDKLHKDALEVLRERFGLECVTDSRPVVLMFLTGGSEAEAVRYLDPGMFQVLLASGRNNAYASAMEVKAYSIGQGSSNILLNLDDERDVFLFEKYSSAIHALNSMKGKRLGLIGEPSAWLVASTVEAEIMQTKLGVELLRIPWGKAGNYQDFEAGEDFMMRYQTGKQYNTEDAGRVNSLLRSLISEHRLDAITVECFPIVQEHEVTACLGLSFLNDLGVPAGCEGDLCSILGMMLLHELTGEMPWMANVASITGNEVLFAHCTAPTAILEEYRVNTHFETGKGTAIRGQFNIEDVTVFRLNNTLDSVFHAHGKVVDGMYEKHACRTQLHVEFDTDVIRELKEDPLGNHHLILPGNHLEVLGILEKILIKV